MLAAALLAAMVQGGTAAQMSQARLDALVREVSASVEELRRLKFKSPVKAEIILPKAARESFKAKIKPWDVEQAGYTQKAYIDLGLIPPRQTSSPATSTWPSAACSAITTPRPRSCACWATWPRTSEAGHRTS
jgi:hypothetical protein